MGTSFIGANLGIKLIPLSVYAIILNLKPILVIILGVFYGIESITLKKICLILLSFLGAMLIVNPDWFSNEYHKFFGNDEKTGDTHSEIERGRSKLKIRK